MGDLLTRLDPTEPIGDGAMVLRGFCADEADKLVLDIEAIARRSPFRAMSVPGGGIMSVAMTNCGRAGWITDQRGYRYSARFPLRPCCRYHRESRSWRQLARRRRGHHPAWWVYSA